MGYKGIILNGDEKELVHRVSVFRWLAQSCRIFLKNATGFFPIK